MRREISVGGFVEKKGRGGEGRGRGNAEKSRGGGKGRNWKGGNYAQLRVNSDRIE